MQRHSSFAGGGKYVAPSVFYVSENFNKLTIYVQFTTGPCKSMLIAIISYVNKAKCTCHVHDSLF
jgi:hypothetical protein